jgi:hypothetical protein
LLGSPSTPGYLPALLQNLSKAEQILALSIMVVYFYAIHVACQKSFARRVTVLSDFLSKGHNKLPIFAEQEALSEGTLSKLASSASGINTAVIFLFVVAMVYPGLFLFLTLLIIVASCSIVALSRFHVGFREKLEQDFRLILQKIIPIGFLTSFAFIVIDFLLPIDPPNIVVAVIGLVLTRQLVARLSGSVILLVTLYRGRDRIQALLLSDKPGIRRLNKKDNMFWSMAKPEYRTVWIGEVVSEIMQRTVTIVQDSWIQTGVDGVIAFAISARIEGDQQEERRILLKLFSEKRALWAGNEAILLQESDLSNLLPPFLGKAKMGNCCVHLFDINDMQKPSHDSIDIAAIKLSIQDDLLFHHPSRDLSDRYAKSHPFVWQRITEQSLGRVSLAGNETQKAAVDEFMARLKEICAILEALPLQFVIPKYYPDSIVKTATGEVKLTSIYNWKIEPLGFGWSAKEGAISKLLNRLDSKPESWALLGEIPREAVILSALVSSFEHLYQSQRWTEALDLVPRILQTQARIEAA